MKDIYKLLYTLTYFISLVPMKIYDILHGTEFSKIEKTGDKDGRFEYYPSPIFSFVLLKRYINLFLQGGKGHAILDIGCGKGYMLNFFRRYTFDKISGLEYDKKLCIKAKKNLKKLHSNIKIYNIDAIDFPAYKYYDVFYMYNPFDEHIMELCIEKILESLKENPRKITVIYCNPLYETVLIKK